jgi:hypothetical protein
MDPEAALGLYQRMARLCLEEGEGGGGGTGGAVA